jgi:hypothetical protein
MCVLRTLLVKIVDTMRDLLPLILALSIQVASPATKPKKPVVQNSEAANKASDSKQASPPVPFNIPVSTPVSQPTANDKKDEHQGETDNRAYRVKVISQPFDWLYLVYVVVTAVAAYVAWRAVIAIRKQGDTMEGQIAEMKAAGIQADKLIDAATKSADAAKRSADALIASERSWVMVDVELNSIRGDDLKYETTKVDLRLIYTNVGKTPAWITEKSVDFALVDTIDDLPDVDSITPFQNRPQWVQTTSSEERVLEHEGYQLQHAGNLRIVYGRIKYRDIFRKERMTTFGYEIDLNDELRRIAVPEKYNENT